MQKHKVDFTEINDEELAQSHFETVLEIADNARIIADLQSANLRLSKKINKIELEIELRTAKEQGEFN